MVCADQEKVKKKNEREMEKEMLKMKEYLEEMDQASESEV